MASNSAEFADKTTADENINFEASLIKAVKEHRCLYQRFHYKYQTKSQNDIAWLKISNTLKISNIACMNMWYSMLQKFLNLSRLEAKGNADANAFKWPHYKAFKDIQSQLVDKYVDLLKMNSNGKNIKITTAQLEYLLTLLQQNNKKLMDVSTSNAERQEIWTDMANRLNAAKNCTPMPVIQWQKVWWDLKQGLGRKIERKGLNSNIMCDLAGKELIILKICSASQVDESQIKERVDSCIEFDADTTSSSNEVEKDLVISEQRSELQNEIHTNDICDDRSEEGLVACGICLGAPFSISCDMTNWSDAAKEIIPRELQNASNLSMCQVCYTNLKRKAALAWKVCRICVKESDNLENILESSFQDVRDAFRNVTKFTFCITDGLPCFVCSNCLKRMLEFNNFYEIFISNQILLQDIHNKNFIGKVLDKASPQKSPEKVSHKRSRSSQDQSTDDTTNPTKLKRLSKGIVSRCIPVISSNFLPPGKIICASKSVIPADKKTIPTDRKIIVSSRQIIPPSCNITSASEVGKVSNSVSVPCSTPAIDISSTPNSQKRNACSLQNMFSGISKMTTPLTQKIVIRKIPKLAQPSVVASIEKSDADPVKNFSQSNVPITKGSNLNQQTAPVFTEDVNTSSHIAAKTSGVRFSTGPIVAKPKDHQSKPTVAPSVAQQTLKPLISIPTSSPLLRKTVINRQRQSLLDGSALKVNLSSSGRLDSPQTITSSDTYSNSLLLHRSTPSQTGYLSTRKLLINKKASEFAQLNGAEKAPQKPPPRRITNHNLSSIKPTSRPRQASLDEETIVIRDDTPPREEQPLKNSNTLQVDLGSAICNLDPSMLYPDTTMEEVFSGRPFLEPDIDLAESQEMEADLVCTEVLELISPSFLINYAVNKAFKKNLVNPQKCEQQSVDDTINAQHSKKVKQSKNLEKTALSSKKGIKKSSRAQGKNNTGKKQNNELKINNNKRENRKQYTESDSFFLTSQDHGKEGKSATDRKQRNIERNNKKENHSEYSQDEEKEGENHTGMKLKNKFEKNNNKKENDKQDTTSYKASLRSQDQRKDGTNLEKNDSNMVKRPRGRPRKDILSQQGKV